VANARASWARHLRFVDGTPTAQVPALAQLFRHAAPGSQSYSSPSVYSCTPWRVPGSSQLCSPRLLFCSPAALPALDAASAIDSFALRFPQSRHVSSFLIASPVSDRVWQVNRGPPLKSCLPLGTTAAACRHLWAGMICTESAHVSGSASHLAPLITIPSPTPGPLGSPTPSLFPFFPLVQCILFELRSC